jgi:hypothetical protein
MLTAAQKKANVCIVVSDLETAYNTGGRLIQSALSDATKELGRAEINITPVNLESNEIYEILRKRLFISMPDKSEIQEIAGLFANKLSEAAKAKSVERSAESLANEIEETYPFHPRFKNLVALFKENERFKQTRGLMELVSRLLKSVWNRESNDVFLMGAQYFDLSQPDVRDKLAEISEMRDVIARDLWDSTGSAHAQTIDQNSQKDTASQVGNLLLTASLSTAVNSVKGVSEAELLECLIDPLRQPSEYKKAFEELQKNAWYLHHTLEGRHYFDRQENLTKKLQGYADKAPQNKVDELIKHKLDELYKPVSKEAYEKVLPLPEISDAEAHLKTTRTLLIISPDGKTPPEVIDNFYKNLVNKNNLLVLTGERSQMANVERAARHMYAVEKTDHEVTQNHPQRKELEEKKIQYANDFLSTILSVFDKVMFPGNNGQDILRSKALDTAYPTNETYNGEKQILKTLISDPLKLYLEVKSNFDGLKSKAESLLFGNQEEVRRVDLADRMKQKTLMPWLPCTNGLNLLIQEACSRGLWEDLGNGYVTKKPKPKTTSIIFEVQGEPNDSGEVRLKVETVNAGSAPKIHYAEDSAVTSNSPTLTENVLVTKALRVQFLVEDPTGKNLTGPICIWENKLTIRNRLEEQTRKVELFVVPRGKLRYTTDGSEARNGVEYSSAIQLDNAETKLYVFAEAEGIEEKNVFTFPAKGKDVVIDPAKRAIIKAGAPKKFDSSSRTHEGLTEAKNKNIQFEQIHLQVGSGSNVISFTIGEIKVSAETIEDFLGRMKELAGPTAPVVLTFKKAYFATGFDLEQYKNKMGIELERGDIIQE